ncbi:MAG: nucleoside hydrolase [Chloroflexota bacterium]
MPRVHLDTDLGGDPDDLCALALLLAWRGVEVTAITTVAEEGGRRAGYARCALALAGRSAIPVAAGADASMARFRYPVAFPDEGAYWPEPVPPLPPASPTAALDLLKHSVDEGATIIAIGPYSNLALFDRAYPGALARVPLYLMGGHIHPMPPGYPQWTGDSDWNMQFDVASALHILERFRPTLVPLEMTVQTALRRADLPRLRRSGPLGALIARQAEAHAVEYHNEERYGQTCSGLPDDTINFHHDPLACAVAVGWDGVAITETPLRPEVRDGWLDTWVDPAGRPMPVVTAVDGPRFDDVWLETVSPQG